MIDTFLSNQPIIISLDVDTLLFERLKQIVQGGFSLVEINSCDKELLRKVLQVFPMLHVGASNITTIEQLENCHAAGVHFISSPGFLPAMTQTAAIYSISYLPGIATISEAMQVMALGGHQVRPYPAPLSFCALLNKCLPTLRLFPAEIEWDEAEHYLSLPSVAAVSIVNPEIKQLHVLSTGMFAQVD